MLDKNIMHKVNFRSIDAEFLSQKDRIFIDNTKKDMLPQLSKAKFNILPDYFTLIDSKVKTFSLEHDLLEDS